MLGRHEWVGREVRHEPTFVPASRIPSSVRHQFSLSVVETTTTIIKESLSRAARSGGQSSLRFRNAIPRSQFDCKLGSMIPGWRQKECETAMVRLRPWMSLKSEI